MQSVPVLEERDRHRDAQPSVCYMPLMKPAGADLSSISSFVAAAAASFPSDGWGRVFGTGGLILLAQTLDLFLLLLSQGFCSGRIMRDCCMCKFRMSLVCGGMEVSLFGWEAWL